MIDFDTPPNEVYVDPDDLPDEGEALPTLATRPMPPRKTGGELWASAPEAVVKGLGGTSLAN